MTIIQTVFASSEGLNGSTNTCLSLQRSLSLRTGVSAASRPLPRARCSAPSCSPFRTQTQIPHMPASQLSNHCSGHSAAGYHCEDNSLTRPREHLTLSWLILQKQCAHAAYIVLKHFNHSLLDGRQVHLKYA